jgi:AcrR family transcriptional regulator
VPKNYHHGDLREALLEQAITSVSAVGAEQLSLRAVAAAVGVSPSAAYHHFADKEALLIAVKERGFEQLESFIAQQITPVDSLEILDLDRVREVMQASALAYINFAIDHPHWFSTMFSGVTELHKPAYIQSSLEHLRELFFISRGIQFEDQMLTEDVLRAAVHGIAAFVVEGRMEREKVPAAIEILSTLMIGPQLVATSKESTND